MQPAKIVPIQKTMSPVTVGRAYGSIAHEWDRMYVDKRAAAENRWLFNWLRRSGYLEGDVLEVACGTGLLLDCAKVDPSKYLGTDISEAMVNAAAMKHPQHVFRVMDMHDLKLPDECVDNVLCLFAGFSYVADPMAVAHELWRVLRPGGRFVVMPYAQRTKQTNAYEVIFKGEPLIRYFHTNNLLRSIFSEFHDVQIRGLSYRLDRLPQWLPQWCFNLMCSWEMALRRGEDCYFNIVTGEK